MGITNGLKILTLFGFNPFLILFSFFNPKKFNKRLNTLPNSENLGNLPPIVSK